MYRTCGADLHAVAEKHAFNLVWTFNLTTKFSVSKCYQLSLGHKRMWIKEICMYQCVYPISLCNLTDDFTGCWINGGEGFPTRCILPLVVDKQLKDSNRSLPEEKLHWSCWKTGHWTCFLIKQIKQNQSLIPPVFCLLICFMGYCDINLTTKFSFCAKVLGRFLLSLQSLEWIRLNGSLSALYFLPSTGVFCLKKRSTGWHELLQCAI